MTIRPLAHAIGAMCAIAIAYLIMGYITTGVPMYITIAMAKELSGNRAVWLSVCLGALLYPLFKRLLSRLLKARNGEKESLYGLQHGKLHLQVPTPMWMNMGHWGGANAPKTMAEACRDLLKAVLADAGFLREIERPGFAKGEPRQRMLIDLGFGCGDQTVYLTSEQPVRSCDRAWWDEREHCVRFDRYIGITKDLVQARYASERVEELRVGEKAVIESNPGRESPTISLFCEDAARPASWSEQLKVRIDGALEDSPDRWMLALDTAYHFSPSRWPVIRHACTNLHASFMAFDLCLSPTATSTQKLVLRVLTALMGSPWANFGTSDEYRRKLVETGYSAGAVTIVDVSEHIFTPLARYLDEQDSRLKMLGLDIGSFSVAKSLFAWWGRSGVVRGVIVVARR